MLHSGKEYINLQIEVSDLPVCKPAVCLKLFQTQVVSPNMSYGIRPAASIPNQLEGRVAGCHSDSQGLLFSPDCSN